MTAQQQQTFMEKYHAAYGTAVEIWMKDNDIPPEDRWYICTKDIYAHPDTIDDLNECSDWWAPLIPDSSMTPGRVSFSFYTYPQTIGNLTLYP